MQLEQAPLATVSAVYLRVAAYWWHPGARPEGASPMDREPTNREVAAEIGITEAEVERYRSDTFRLDDGSWLIHFGFLMPKELRQGLTGSFTFILKADRKSGDLSRPDW
ncbi:hypothetical protein [Pseudomonas mosselii]|uniref:hypothetical protein n=1 Tax=Pseudomonas mosselii TaxID=78327 RepID=UPI001E642B07|nr:hypothetical protein [Pseudomonas mosselii]MDH1099891.1 hypothetical protein [Pseudomonas mosselii]MEA3233251.1 hypothetical protein [Pseudomonas mosselii]UVN46267.1 hypothetical protein NW905_09810 [Pseudomonas mosselii]UWS65369.1 hypothetical protein N0U38_16390 [Pseudomonas mosselii]